METSRSQAHPVHGCCWETSQVEIQPLNCYVCFVFLFFFQLKTRTRVLDLVFFFFLFFFSAAFPPKQRRPSAPARLRSLGQELYVAPRHMTSAAWDILAEGASLRRRGVGAPEKTGTRGVVLFFLGGTVGPPKMPKWGASTWEKAFPLIFFLAQ